VIRSLEVEDVSPTSTRLMTLQRWMERVAEKEVERIAAKCRRYQEQGKTVPRWAWAGLNAEELVEIRDVLMSYLFLTRGTDWT